MKKKKYTGINRLLKSDSIQTLLNRFYDGTFSEFIDDWKWIFSFSKKYRWIIVFYTVVGIFGSTLGLGSAYVGRILINIVVGQQKDQLWVLVGAMLGMTIFSLALSSVNSRIFTRISIYVNNDIQAEIFDKIIDARWSDLSRYPSGDLLNRFNGDVGAEILELLKEDTTPGQVHAALIAQHPESTVDEIGHALADFLNQLVREGLLITD